MKTKFNPKIKDFETMWGLWWGMTWRIYAVVFAFYAVFGVIGLVSIGVNAL